MEVSKEVLDFLTGVHGDRKNTEKRKETIFDRAFELAYKDMATHTVYYKKGAKQKFVSDDSKRCNNNKIKIRNAIKEYVKDNIFGDILLKKVKNISSKAKFNDWHKSACDCLVEINCDVNDLEQKGEKRTDVTLISKPISDLLCHADSNITEVFTYGQAQKLINMMVKYLYIFYQCEGLDDLEDLKNIAHVPIDSYVLEEVSEKDVYNGTSWSKFQSYDMYMKYKEKIDNKADNKAAGSPFLWELANWPFNKS